MSDVEQIIRTRLKWVQLYQSTNDAGLVCRRCGISRPTLRKWWRRFQTAGEAGLREHSRCPLRTPLPKVTPQYEKLILQFRRKRNLGAKRIQAELLRHHNWRVSTATIWKVLAQHQAPPLRRHRAPQAPIRYSRPVPGERVQVDTTKIAPGIYQYTAIDDCTRFRVLGIYSRRTASNSVRFLEERMIYEFPFPIQRILHWWKKKDLPFVGPSMIAKRMGVSRRTVERQLKELCDMGLVEKKPLPDHLNDNGYTIGYDLGGLVAELETLTPAEAKSGKIALRIQELRAARAEAAARENSEEAQERLFRVAGMIPPQESPFQKAMLH